MGASSSQHLRFQETRGGEGLVHTYTTPKPGELRKDYLKFEDSLGYIMSPYLRNNPRVCYISGTPGTNPPKH